MLGGVTTETRTARLRAARWPPFWCGDLDEFQKVQAKRLEPGEGKAGEPRCPIRSKVAALASDQWRRAAPFYSTFLSEALICVRSCADPKDRD